MIKDYYPRYTKDRQNSTTITTKTWLENGPKTLNRSLTKEDIYGKAHGDTPHQISSELQSKTTMRFCNTSIRLAKNSEHQTNINKCWWEYEVTATLIHGGTVEMKNGTATLKTVWKFLTKLNIFLHTMKQSPSLVFTQRSWKTYIHTKICTWIFKAVLFITAQTSGSNQMSFSR